MRTPTEVRIAGSFNCKTITVDEKVTSEMSRLRATAKYNMVVTSLRRAFQEVEKTCIHLVCHNIVSVKYVEDMLCHVQKIYVAEPCVYVLSECSTSSQIAMHGYRSICAAPSGNVTMLVHHTVECKAMITTCNVIAIESNQFVVIGCYCSPTRISNGCIRDDLLMVSQIMKSLPLSFKPVFVVGDFNYAPTARSEYALNWRRLLTQHGFEMLHTGPTTIYNTVIDHVWYRNCIKSVRSFVGWAPWSDHNMIFVKL